MKNIDIHANKYENIIEKGYLFIVTGEKYLNELRVSLPQLRKFSSLPICVASDIQLDLEYDYFININNPQYSYFDKVKYIGFSPFRKTIFLDSDISFFYCPDEIFDGLDGVDLMVSHEAGLGFNKNSEKAMIPNVFPELSSGMIVFKNNTRVNNMFNLWEKEYNYLYCQHGIIEDQPSLRKALFKSDIKFSILPPEYHFIPAIFTRVIGKKVFTVHNHSFQRARSIGLLFNDRRYNDCCAYIDGFGVIRNPYAMGFRESIKFIIKTNILYIFIIIRALYINIKNIKLTV